MTNQLALDGSGYTATFSHDRLYRYSLHRIWSREQPPAMFVGLNPSTADEQTNDPTVRRCIRFARDWGYGGLVMTNLYAWRATDPNGLRVPADPVGPGNDAALRELAAAAGIVVCAWGSWDGPDPMRAAIVVDLLPEEIHILGLTRNRQPRHPLYMPAATKPELWRM